MRHVSARLVPKTLNFLQKEYRIKVTEEMLYNVFNEPNFLKHIIKVMRSWVYEYNMETSQCNRQNGGKKASQNQKTEAKSNIKILLTVFFDYEDIVHSEFLPTSLTIDKEYYLAVMHHLYEATCKKTSEIVERKQLIFAL